MSDEIRIVEDLVISAQQQDGLLRLPTVRQGTVGVVLRNGRVEKLLEPGKRLMVRLPFQSVETMIVDTKIRNLDIISQGEFLTRDNRRVNVSLNLSYQVYDPVRVAVEYAEPIRTLYDKVKDLLGLTIGQHDFTPLAQAGRQIVRQEILQAANEVQALGIKFIDVRINDLTLPDRVGSALDAHQAARLEGEAAQQQLRGKWQDIPEQVQRYHLQEKVAEGGMFINPAIPGVQVPGVPGAGYPPQIAPQNRGQPPAINHQAATQALGNMWGQLVVTSGIHQGQVFPLQKPAALIGRGAQCDVVLGDAGVSGQHARLEQRGGQIILQDLDSSNGTWVDQIRVTQPAVLNGGETIIFANAAVRFERFS